MTTSAKPLRATADPAVRRAVSGGERPPPPGAGAAVLVHGRRAMLKIKHAPQQLIDIFVMPLVFLLMFTYLFGGAIGGSHREYLQYLLPGILVLSVMTITLYSGAALNTDITQGIHDRFRTLPFWQPSSVLGTLFGGVVRYTVALTVGVLVGLALGFRPDGGVPGVLLTMLALLLFAISVGWIFTALGVVVRSPETITTGGMMLLGPLLFTSNIFVDPGTMPGWMQVIVDLNPATHAATAARGLMHGTATAGEITVLLLLCAGLTAVFAPLTVLLYRRR
ncbi:MAG TPA: ABC transporter permease [Thermomonospora sp.]|nr:ABC transporter permease [Thermomonospora sp.]